MCSLTALLAVAAVVLVDLGVSDGDATAIPLAIAAVMAPLLLVWVFGGGSPHRLLHLRSPMLIAMTTLMILGSL